MEMNEIKWQSFSDYLTKTNPILQKQEALYRLTFQNGKIYFGQSTDILARIETHLVKIQGLKNHLILNGIQMRGMIMDLNLNRFMK